LVNSAAVSVVAFFSVDADRRAGAGGRNSPADQLVMLANMPGS
jgi:hypothetical protein